MSHKPQSIASMEELMQALPQIFKTANADPAFGLRFAANPIMAAEELGYTMTEEMKQIATRRVRFSTQAYERLQQLEQQVWELAGERFDLDSGEAVSRVLIEKLKLPHPQAQPPKTQKSKVKPKAADETLVSAHRLVAFSQLAAPLTAQSLGHAQIEDPLEPLRNAHPVMRPLLEYRQLEASSPRLAPRALYERISRGEIKVPVTRLQFNWKPKQ